jgi:hypothetical protein
MSIAAHLLRLRDTATGAPLPDDLLAGEFGLFFSAGIESAGNAISWAVYAHLLHALFLSPPACASMHAPLAILACCMAGKCNISDVLLCHMAEQKHGVLGKQRACCINGRMADMAGIQLRWLLM